MIRSAWNVLAIVAIANLVALVGFVGFLGMTGRMSARRVDAIRTMLRETVAEQTAREAREAQQAEARKAADEARAREGTVPLSAADLLRVKLEQSDADRIRQERLEQSAEQLRSTLARREAEIAQREAELDQRIKAYNEERARRAAVEGSEQFQVALSAYQGLKPEEAKLGLMRLIDQGSIEQVVLYLNAMQTRSRTKIIDSFMKDDPAVASDLIERLRTLGEMPQGPGAPSP